MNTSPIALTLALLKGLSESTNNPTMPLQQVQLFLHVAYLGEVPMEDLEEATGVEQSSVSRNVAALGGGQHRKPGYGLVHAYRDPNNHRRKLVRLTEKGKALAWDISRAGVPSKRPVHAGACAREERATGATAFQVMKGRA